MLQPADVPQLQRTIGNHAVARVLNGEPPNHEYRSPLPHALRAGVEQLSGVALDDVEVHHNSPAPGRLLAAAYTQGPEIHLAPGREADLAHEAWHVVQQKRGVVPATGRVAGAPINNSPALEREADEMGAHAARLTSAHAPRPATPIAARAPTSSPVIQARWLVAPDGKACFWEEDGTPASDRPYFLRGVKKIDAPKPSSYSVEPSTSDVRPRRGARTFYTHEHFVAIKNLKEPSAPKDNYNPFGRFASPKVSSFVPSPQLSDALRTSLLERLAEKDKTFKKQTGLPPNVGTSLRGYPLQILVEGGATLDYIEETDFGAVYALGPPNPASSDPVRAEDVTGLTNLPPTSADVKIGTNFAITPKGMEPWSGEKRGISQNTVMGASAGDVVANAGFDKDEGLGWEWLHMIAHSMGGLEVHGPQVSGNLVAGTSECNTQMIVVEELIKDIVKKSGGRAALWVGVRMYDEVRHIGDQITYDFELYNAKNEPVAVYHWSFNALSRRQPVTMENRSARYAAQGLYGMKGGAEKATPQLVTHMPRSQPTAHGPLVLAPDDPITKVVNDAMTAFKALPADQFVAQLVTLRAVRGGSLPKDVFVELGDQLTPEQLPTYLKLLHAGYPHPRAVTVVLYNFLFRHHEPAKLEALWKEVLVPLYGSEAAVPAVVGEMVRSWATRAASQATTASNQPVAKT
ncbi:MAG TPA: DUF4157 domain-containing protein [Solirubrobacteraceae bacterium]|nr:DUF4157 domain-containing protein [Solirubrobacteraceae bacterium]